MRVQQLIAVATLIAIAGCGSEPSVQEGLQPAAALSVEVYNGEIATVNSYIFSNGESLIVMDVQRATSEAKKLAEIIKKKDLPLTHILITHGHPDHYIGMDFLKNEFPAVEIVVASEGVKQDIIGFSTWMESVGWLDAEPSLKPKSKTNPEGFDYDNEISVLPTNVLEFVGGGELVLETDYEPTEAEHMTTVYVESLNAFFPADLGYNKVHLWMGSGVTDENIENWKDQLIEFQRLYGARNPIVYPGHGDVTDLSLFTDMVEYMEDFQRVTGSTTSREEAMAQMKALYPDYQQADFLLKYSVDFHVTEQ